MKKTTPYGGNEKVVCRSEKTIGGFLEAKYYLTELSLCPEEEFGKAYSVYAEVTDTRTGSCENGSILDVTRDRAFAVKIFDLVSRGGVTPISLSDVVSDLISN